MIRIYKPVVIYCKQLDYLRDEETYEIEYKYMNKKFITTMRRNLVNYECTFEPQLEKSMNQKEFEVQILKIVRRIKAHI